MVRNKIIDPILWRRAAESLQLTDLSDNFNQVFGAVPEGWYESPSALLAHVIGEDRERVKSIWSQEPASLHGLSVEYRLQTPDDNIFAIRENIRYQKLAGGGAELWGTLHLVSSASIEEEVMRICSQMFDDNEMGLFILRPLDDEDENSFVFLACNESASKHTGVPMEQTIGRPFLSRFPKLRGTGVITTYLRVIHTQQPERLPDVTYGDAEMEDQVYHVRAFPVLEDCVGVVFENVSQQVAEHDAMQRVVDQRTAELRRIERSIAIKYAFSQALVGGQTVDKALQQILERGCDLLEFDLGAFWLVVDDRLVCRKVWQTPGCHAEIFSQACYKTTFTPGEGLLGRVWDSASPLWVEDLQESEMLREQDPDHARLRSGLVFPIREPGCRPLGLVEFYSQENRESDPVVTAIASDLSGHLADYISRWKAQEALFETESQYAIVAQTLSDAIVTVNEDSIVLFANDATNRVFGYRPDEITGREVTVLMPESIRSVHRQGLQHYLETGRRNLEWHGFEVMARHRTGKEFPVSVSLGEYEVGGKRFITAIMRDITESRMREQQLREAKEVALESLRVKSDFLANMSHEIRTPMNGVIGMTGLLLETSLSSDQKEFAQAIRSSAQNLLSVVNDILDFSRIEAGKFRVENVSFHLAESVEEVVSLLVRDAAAKELDFQVLISPEVPNHLKGDPARVWQIMMNLISNAIKFTESGSVLLNVRLTEQVEDVATLRFEVTDTGVGISEENQSLLFQPFSQVDASYARRHQGTGLGLVISSQLVKLMGGEIGVESQPGEGATFWFSLPLRVLEKKADDWSESLRGRRLLIVDDNSTNRRILRSQLSQWDLEIEEAVDAVGAEALLRKATAEGRHIEMMLLDVQMPGESGIAFAQRLYGEESFPGLGVVIMSSVDQMVELSQDPKLQVDAILRKPASARQLHSCLCDLLTAPVKTIVKAAVSSRSAKPTPPDFFARYAKVRILIAEDNAINQRIISLQLKKMGLESDCVANGQEVLELIERIPYHLILMDCQMPILDGYEAARRLRDLPGGEKYVVVALTANALEGERERCLVAGMDEYLTKPLSADSLRETLVSWLPEAVHRQSSKKVVPRCANHAHKPPPK